MASPTSAPAASEATDGPVLSLLNKRLRALRKKLNRIHQMEESIAQGKPINKEQEEVLRSKPSVLASIDELEKFRLPLAAAMSEEIANAIELHQKQQSSVSSSDKDESKTNNGEISESGSFDLVKDLLNVLYFGSLFDVKSQSEFTAVMLTRTHERGCCLTYDYMTDDADDVTDLLGERDLDMISMLSGLLISRPVDSTLSHKDALQRCIEHAKLWLANSDHPIGANANVSYAELRERLNKIKASDYFTTTPKMKAADEVAAAAGNYASFQVPMHGVPVEAVDSVVHYQEKDEVSVDFLGHENVGNQPSLPEEVQKDEVDTENPAEIVPSQQEQDKPTELESDHRDVEPKEQQYNSRRHYQNQRGSRGGRRGYSNGHGRGGRIGGRGGGGGGGGYQNGRNQYYDQPGNYYPRHYNNRGRGGRGGGNPYNNHSPTGSHAPADDGAL